MKKTTNYTLLILFALAIAGTWQACSDEDQTTADPQVKTFTPEGGGPVGTYVVISGNFFSPKADENVVKFNGVDAKVISSTISTITTTVPAGASSGNISVSVKGHEGATPASFAVTAGTPAPVILGFDPKTGFGSEGTTVTITGLNFGTTPVANVIKFNGVTATITEATATSLKATVPVGARTGKLTVTSNALAQGVGSSDTDFAVPGPSVSKFTPTYSIQGSTVEITGENFSETAAKNIVTFNGVAADEPINVTKTSLTVIVPPGATTGSLKVTVDGQAADAGEFNLPHSITSFTPLLGPVGTDVVITGVNFSSKPENNVVKFNGKEVADKPTEVTHTSLKVKVPAGATTGKITVTINGRKAESLVNFTVN